ncbi:MAG TPA: hypothetical protein VMH86_09430 [Rhizomicrobium sp.]|nr:hypothetical protein [Rhizomicrobium sp.]
MNKIPVGKTIAFAYQFTFGHLGVIIGLIWIPTVLVAVGGFFAESHYGPVIMTASGGSDQAAAGQAIVSMFAWYVVSMLLTAIASTAVTRQAMGLRKGGAMFHFALGPMEFRVFAAQMALFGVAVALALPYIVLLTAVATFAEASGAASSGASLAAAAIGLGGAGLLLFAIVRLSFLLLPATVAESRIGLGRSWTLTRGNFWRIVAIGLCTLGPILVVLAAGQYAILGPRYFDLALLAAHDPSSQAKIAAEQSQIMMQHLPLSFGLSLLVAPFSFGLLLAPSAYAYRVLTGSAAS